MSKRRIENGINELSEEILSDLSPDKRVQLLLEAYGTGKGEWFRSLAETCPRHRYIQPDQRVDSRMKMLYLFAAQAVYELHTTYLEYQLCWQKQVFSWFEESLSEEGREQVQARVSRPFGNWLRASIYCITVIGDSRPRRWTSMSTHGSSFIPTGLLSSLPLVTCWMIDGRSGS